MFDEKEFFISSDKGYYSLSLFKVFLNDKYFFVFIYLWNVFIIL